MVRLVIKEIIRVFLSIFQLNWVFNTFDWFKNHWKWLSLASLWLVLNWTFREFDIFSSFSSPRWFCPDYPRKPSCSWSLSLSHRRPCQHFPWSWLMSRHKEPAITWSSVNAAAGSLVATDLPLSCTVVGRGLLNLSVVGQVGLVAHQYEGDVVVVLHPQYLISKLLQDNPTVRNPQVLAVCVHLCWLKRIIFCNGKYTEKSLPTPEVIISDGSIILLPGSV